MIAIISDVHANLSALTAVLNEIDRQGISDVVCLGDTAGYHCDINECCELLRERGVFSLLGNHDWYLVSGEVVERSHSANLCIEYQRQVVTDDNLAWLKSLEPAGTVGKLSLVHGGWQDPVDEYVSPSPDYFAGLEGNWFSSGHTHVPVVWSSGSDSYCNPGSVGQPRDGDPRASFATFDDEQFNIHRIEYDIASIQSRMAAAGFDAYFYENLSAGTRLGGKIDSY